MSRFAGHDGTGSDSELAPSSHSEEMDTVITLTLFRTSPYKARFALRHHVAGSWPQDTYEVVAGDLAIAPRESSVDVARKFAEELLTLLAAAPDAVVIDVYEQLALW